MLKKKRGSIVSISSISGITGNRGQVNYSAAKAGIIGASKALATEVARLGIRVNVVAPGLIETEMTRDMPVDMIKQMIPMARIGQPEEVAATVTWLCSDESSFPLFRRCRLCHRRSHFRRRWHGISGITALNRP